MTQEIDCRGLACPEPVLKAKEAIEQGFATFKIVVDNDAAVENVSRFITSRGFQVSVVSEGNGVSAVTGTRDDSQAGAVPETAVEEVDSSENQKIMIMIASIRIGRGDDKLGEKLMLSYLKTIREMGDDLWRLVFVNEGVKFAIKGSKLISELKFLEEEGVHILVCGTCLTHFNILEQKEIGETTNMLDIVTSMQLADKVINL
ncbi:MAG: sulfurtransferase-like selenium metabolism protein YedF [Thermodesulfobacteriota bacterium]|nr:sulfurtransferase-like selenium metabolism protein YedF [Thermodesulfobacteriota bacterium]